MSITKITEEAFEQLTSVVSESPSLLVLPASGEEKKEEDSGHPMLSYSGSSPSLSPQEFLNSKLGQHSPEDVFAGMLEIFQPRFDLLLNKLSNNQLRRLIRALIKGALNTEKISDKVTKEAFFLGEKLLLAQMMLVAKGFSEQNNKGDEPVSEGENSNVGTKGTVEPSNGGQFVQVEGTNI